MLIIGLTGSVGMGKSTAAKRFRAHDIPVLDADAVVRALYAGKAVSLIEAEFPGTTLDGRVDRVALRQALSDDPSRFKELENIVHPLVAAEERAFIQDSARRDAPAVVLEVPLLFETGRSEMVDLVVVVSAPTEVQRERVLSRPGMTEERFQELLARQMSDEDKRTRADFVVDTSGSIEASAMQIDKIIESLKGRDGIALKCWCSGPASQA